MLIVVRVILFAVVGVGLIVDFMEIFGCVVVLVVMDDHWIWFGGRVTIMGLVPRWPLDLIWVVVAFGVASDGLVVCFWLLVSHVPCSCTPCFISVLRPAPFPPLQQPTDPYTLPLRITFAPNIAAETYNEPPPLIIPPESTLFPSSSSSASGMSLSVDPSLPSPSFSLPFLSPFFPFPSSSLSLYPQLPSISTSLHRSHSFLALRHLPRALRYLPLRLPL